MEEAVTDLLQNDITNLEKRLDTLVKLSPEDEQTLQTGSDVLVYDSVSEIQDMGLDNPQTPNIDIPEFTSGNNRHVHLEQAMGEMKAPADHLQTGPAPSGHSTQGPVVRQSTPTEIGQASTGAVYKLRDSPTVISHFSYEDDITSICPTHDGHAWLCDYALNIVALINNNGEVIQKIKHHSNIQYISLDPSTGHLWFCCFNECTVYEVSTLSTPVKRFDTYWYPASLCVTREGRVLMGTQGRQGSKVVMYTPAGQVMHTATVDQSGSMSVQSISQCAVTANVAVVSSQFISGDDREADSYRRHVIVYNPTLQPLFHYEGEGTQTLDKFDPVTAVYDSKGNIVIADRKRNTIELINGEGRFIKTLHTNKGQGMVGIQKDDVLWSCLELDTGEWGLKLLKYYSD